MDSDLAWVNGKSGRQSWRYADAFQRSIKSEAIYHFLNSHQKFCTVVDSIHRNNVHRNRPGTTLLWQDVCPLVRLSQSSTIKTA